eukprot:529815-Prymnesium_polylepis.1
MSVHYQGRHGRQSARVAVHHYAANHQAMPPRHRRAVATAQAPPPRPLDSSAVGVQVRAR